jgi:hypothetical protein
VKTAAAAVTNYGTNGGSVAAQNNWAANFSSNIDAILSAAIKAVPLWQSAVATQQAATNMTNGLTRAKSNEPAIVTKVNGVGKASFTAGVKAAAAPGGDYALFAPAWMSAVASQVSGLNVTYPRGDRSQNRARQAAYDAWVDTQAGKFRVK